MIKNRKAWIKRHGFTNGLWRLEERARLAKAAKERNEQVAEPLRTIVNQISECPPWPEWRNVD